jgi:hypothetical protein
MIVAHSRNVNISASNVWSSLLPFMIIRRPGSAALALSKP